MPRADVAIVGAGILGLTHAYFATKSGKRVVIFERTGRAYGASTRNFGMVWPIGQPPGTLYDLALRSRQHWLEFLEKARLPYFPVGSLHACYRQDEQAVCEEFAAVAPGQGVEVAWLGREATLAKSGALQEQGLLGALWSPAEVIVDPRVVLAKFPEYLREQWGVTLCFRTPVHEVKLPQLRAGGETWEVEEVVVCGGEDFESLYPEHLAASGVQRCKLQMLRTVPQPAGWELGPSLAAGLTLRFYKSFRVCRSLATLEARIAEELPEYNRWGIHVMASQTADGALTLGDSHEYEDIDIFNKEYVDELILRYLDGFLKVPDRRIAERWYGVYAVHPSEPWVVLEPEPGVRCVTGIGGKGMTMSFGFAEKNWKEWNG